MAVLFALSIAGSRVRHPIADRLRAVYTFGQPMTVCTPLPDWTEAVGARLFRYVNTRDLIPALPPAAWGPFTHFGHEYRYTLGEWQTAHTHVAPLTSVREIPKAVLAPFAREKQRGSYKYSLGDHAPHHYVAALRPPGGRPAGRPEAATGPELFPRVDNRQRKRRSDGLSPARADRRDRRAAMAARAPLAQRGPLSRSATAHGELARWA